MKILAIIGSPRTAGNTYKTVLQIEHQLSEKDAGIRFENIQLAEEPLEACRGCFACIAKGEEKCPLKDGRQALEEKMMQADALLFAAPVYVYNMPAILKNFFDRMAYRCHRPDFQGKKAMVLVTTGSVGISFVSAILSSTISAMGFIPCAKAGITYPPAHERSEKKLQRETQNLNRQVNRFYDKITSSGPAKASLIKMIIFKMQQKAFAKAPLASADYRYWTQKGWLDKSTAYYAPIRINSAKKFLAAIAAKMAP